MTSHEVIVMQRLEIAQLKSKVENLEKVIENLKTNQVSIHILLETNSVKEYNFCVNYNQLLTKEEYDLLKGYFKLIAKNMEY